MGRAKQLWLTTPLAMKSPVPVVMSYRRIVLPTGRIETTRSRAADFSASPSIERLRVIAGSVPRRKRIRSGSPPRRRIWVSPLRFGWDSTATSKPKRARQARIQTRISGSEFAILIVWWLCDPSASKMPARNPLIHDRLGRVGHWMSSPTRATFASLWASIAPIGLRLPTAAAEKANSLVSTPRQFKYSRARVRASASASARRNRWTSARARCGRS